MLLLIIRKGPLGSCIMLYVMISYYIVSFLTITGGDVFVECGKTPVLTLPQRLLKDLQENVLFKFF